MEIKSLINQLRLAYAPHTAYEFVITKNDVFIENANLYVIAQRSALIFEKIVIDEINYSLNFEIHQKGNRNIITGKLPQIQKAVDSSEDDTIAIAFNHLNKSEMQNTFPLSIIHGFTLVQVSENEKKFSIWSLPEKLLKNWWTGIVVCLIGGGCKSFTSYKVHYVGKATMQSILKKLMGQSNLQDISSTKSSVTEKQLPSKEIVLLPFEF